MKNNLNLAIAVVLGISFIIMCNNNEYLKKHTSQYEVLDNLYQSGSRRSHERFYLIVKSENGQVFDVPVRPYVISQYKKGSKIYLELSQFDIQQDVYNNTVWTILPISLLIASIIFLWIWFYNRI